MRGKGAVVLPSAPLLWRFGEIGYVARMKFAMLGADEETLALARYLANSPEHQLIAVYEAGPYESLLAAGDSGLIRRGAWESLLHEPVAEAVIVAEGPPAMRAEQLGKLAKAGVPLLVVWPTCDVVAAYELEMIRRDTRAPLVPLIPGRLHPGLVRLSMLARGDNPAGLGPLEQAVLERSLPARDRETVLRQFTRDVELLRAVAGEVKQVGAMGPAADAAVWNNISVQMSGAGQILMRWSVLPADERPGGRLVVFGRDGKATLEMPDSQRWTLKVAGGRPLEETFDAWNESAAAIEIFVRAVQGAAVAPTWQDACRDVELASTVERSLAKGRTIELYDEEISEEATFKGMMAVGGCGMLMLGLLGVVVAAAVEGLHLPFRHHLWWRIWPAYLLAPTLIFLALQFLRLVFRDRKKTSLEKASLDGEGAE